MKIAVRYQTRGGNTKEAAEAIAKAAGVKAEPIYVAIREPIDLLFIGGGVYTFDIDRSLKEFIKTIDNDIVKSVAIFTTSGFISVTNKIITAAQAKNIKVIEHSLTLRLGWRRAGQSKKKGNRFLNDKQLKSINDFVTRSTIAWKHI